MIHPLSDVQSKNIGQDTNIWQFCVVLKDAVIGNNCNICSHVFIENEVKIGNNVTIKCGVQVWDGTIIEDNVFIGPNVTLCNDRYPKSRNKNWKCEGITIKRGASIGANATILPGITIGENAVIGAGAIVTKDVPANKTVIMRIDAESTETKIKKLQKLIFKYKLLHFFYKPRKKYNFIIKCDDLSAYSEAVQLMDSIVQQENIRVSWGIIGKSLENPSNSYVAFLKNKKDDKHYHFFNHGYLHLWEGNFEFNGPSIKQQFEYLTKTQTLAKDKANLILNTFGAPCNQVSENTSIVLDKIPEIKYWYFGLSQSKKTVLSYPSSINQISSLCTYILEKKAGDIDFYFFRNLWEKNIINRTSPIVLQVHPNMWNEVHWLHFKLLIAYLKFIGGEFIIPGQEVKHG